MKAILNTEAGLAFVDNDTELYKTLLQAYISDSSFDKNRFRLLIDSGRQSEAASYVHRLKGASAQIGAEQIYDTCFLLERILRGVAESSIEKLSEQAAEEFTQTAAAVREALSHL